MLPSQQHHSGSESSEKGHSWTWNEITHFLSSQQRVGVRTLEHNQRPAIRFITHFLSSQHGSENSEKGYSWTCHGTTHLLSNQQDQSGNEDSGKRYNWTCHRITHILSSQQDQSGSEKSEKRYSWTFYGITHFLSSQQGQSGSEDGKKGYARSGTESLTICQTNSTRVAVRTVRGDTAEPGMELALTSCQANRTSSSE